MSLISLVGFRSRENNWQAMSRVTVGGWSLDGSMNSQQAGSVRLAHGGQGRLGCRKVSGVGGVILR